MTKKSDQKAQIFYGTLELYYETGFDTCLWALEEDTELLHQRMLADPPPVPTPQQDNLRNDPVLLRQSMFSFYRNKKENSSLSDEEIDKLTDGLMGDHEKAENEYYKQHPFYSPYVGLHKIEQGDTLLVGVNRNKFISLDTEDILSVDKLHGRLKKKAVVPPNDKFWTDIYTNIVFDYDINKIDLATDPHLQAVSSMTPGYGPSGFAQRIDGNTVDGVPMNVRPETWLDYFKYGFPAVLIKHAKPQ